MEITSSNSQFSDSGSVEVYTGNGGDIILNTGASLDRIPGAIRLQSGGGEEIGGNVLIAAGEALNTASTGGSVIMSAGGQSRTWWRVQLDWWPFPGIKQ